MAIPTLLAVTDVVTQALKRGGRTTPTAAQIDEAITHAFQEVKADIMLIAPTHRNLMQTAITVTTRGLQRYSVPADYNEQSSIVLLSTPDEWTGTAQFGDTFEITLALSTTFTTDDLIGKYILITSGPGAEEYNQIVGYDPNTKIATMDLAWLANPTSASTYAIIRETQQLYPNSTAFDFDRISYSSEVGKPCIASMSGQEFLLYPVPDKSSYGLLTRYWVDLSKVNETSDLMLQLLREWRSLWIQGVAVKTMQRYDEDRYQSELSVYKTMLDSLSNQTCQVTVSRFMDV